MVAPLMIPIGAMVRCVGGVVPEQVDGRSWTAANAEQTKLLLSFETRFTSLWLFVLDYDIEHTPCRFVYRDRFTAGILNVHHFPSLFV